MNKIVCFLQAGEIENLEQISKQLFNSELVSKIYVLVTPQTQNISMPQGVDCCRISEKNSSDMIRQMEKYCGKEKYILLYDKSLPIKIGKWALERLVQTIKYTGAGMVYSDYYSWKNGKLVKNPVIDYQEGSFRDDFNFGSLVMFSADAFKIATSEINENYRYAGLYQLRLEIFKRSKIFHLPEYLYTEIEEDNRKSGEKIFDYVNPKNKELQIEMEKVCTEYLMNIGAYLNPKVETINLEEKYFETEASVIIPVKNRVKTIEDAVKSALKQKTSFKYNVIVVDNYSNDGTTDILNRLTKEDDRIIHLKPLSDDFGIGGCWNIAVMDERCGKFAIQLDSDDLYIDDSVISDIVSVFYEQNCAMVIGAYKMVDFELNELPPGLIDHREWTPENGKNNALRINGLGAPRAFYSPLLRKIKFPNVSYGEDYSIGLAFSRLYRIGRIYKPLYLCRRWEDNSDALLDAEKVNQNNFYKDRIRTMELWARIDMNRE